MSDWYLPRPDQEYLDRAWEKNPPAKNTVDDLATTHGLETQVGEWVAEYTPEQNARHRAYQMQDRIRTEATLYALWLQHCDEMEQHRVAIEQRNEQAWRVLHKVLEGQRAGRKTIKIADLMEPTDE